MARLLSIRQVGFWSARLMNTLEDMLDNTCKSASSSADVMLGEATLHEAGSYIVSLNATSLAEFWTAFSRGLATLERNEYIEVVRDEGNWQAIVKITLLKHLGA